MLENKIIIHCFKIPCIYIKNNRDIYTNSWTDKAEQQNGYFSMENTNTRERSYTLQNGKEKEIRVFVE